MPKWVTFAGRECLLVGDDPMHPIHGAVLATARQYRWFLPPFGRLWPDGVVRNDDFFELGTRDDIKVLVEHAAVAPNLVGRFLAWLSR